MTRPVRGFPSGRDLRGSRYRCLLATSQPRIQVAAFLSDLTGGRAAIDSGSRWLPDGLWEPQEARIAESEGLLNQELRNRIADWWLVNRARANTPNWDIVSTCQIARKPGLLLVEGKAHLGEVAVDACGASDAVNLAQIRMALKEASDGWNRVISGFALSESAHYQLSNRFAFAWKLASMGIPVVLVYLGFLDAEDMAAGGRKLIRSLSQWRDHVIEQAANVVPRNAWDSTHIVSGNEVTVLLRTARVTLVTRLFD